MGLWVEYGGGGANAESFTYPENVLLSEQKLF